ncbi:MAG: DUF427 domain-containing protein [Coriobacteriia bacterium]|nr:DUF427 domain-containing protein [Coriobacteriia bacterium]
MQPQRIEPRPGQESVWDYPRPPSTELTDRHVQAYFAGELIADTCRSIRVLETGHPPVYYVPVEDVRTEYLSASPRTTYCEYKGPAHYYTLQIGDQVAMEAACYHPEPTASYASLTGHVAFYPGRVSTCLVDDEIVQPQPGEFYGGWITSEIIGPFKGGPGTLGW